MKTAINNLANRGRDARLWRALFVGETIVFALAIWFLVQGLHSQQTIVILDDETVYLTKSLEFTEAKDLHDSQAELAVQTLLNRHPGGVDSPKRLQRLFGFDALEKAQYLIEQESAEFEAKQLRQKVEIAEVKQLKLRNDSVKVTVSGQLIRTGRFGGKNLVEVLDFEMGILFTRNRNMLENGRYPTVVTSFQLETQPFTTR